MPLVSTPQTESATRVGGGNSCMYTSPQEQAKGFSTPFMKKAILNMMEAISKFMVLQLLGTNLDNQSTMISILLRTIIVPLFSKPREIQLIVIKQLNEAITHNKDYLKY